MAPNPISQRKAKRERDTRAEVVQEIINREQGEETRRNATKRGSAPVHAPSQSAVCRSGEGDVHVLNPQTPQPCFSSLRAASAQSPSPSSSQTSLPSLQHAARPRSRSRRGGESSPRSAPLLSPLALPSGIATPRPDGHRHRRPVPPGRAATEAEGTEKKRGGRGGRRGRWAPRPGSAWGPAGEALCRATAGTTALLVAKG